VYLDLSPAGLLEFELGLDSDTLLLHEPTSLLTFSNELEFKLTQTPFK
jgi:hypothetical protein